MVNIVTSGVKSNYMKSCRDLGRYRVSALNSGSGSLVSSPGWGQCVVFLGKTLLSHSASFYRGVKVSISKFWGQPDKMRGMIWQGKASQPGGELQVQASLTQGE